jgi:hypothetical protein
MKTVSLIKNKIINFSKDIKRQFSIRSQQSYLVLWEVAYQKELILATN